VISHSRPWLDYREDAAVTAVLHSAMLARGAQAASFASTLGGSIGETTLFSSGRQALLAALLALDLPPKTGVAVQSYVCDAAIWAIGQAGLTPTLCDIGAHWTCTPDTVAASIDESCGAILLAPPFGFLQSAAPFRRFGLPIVHDLCQASPAIAQTAMREELGDLVAFSFHPTKYICAAGGGAIVSLTDPYKAPLRALQDRFSQSAPFSDIQAAIGRAQYAKILEIKTRRQNIFDIYAEYLPSHVLQPLHEAMDTSPGDLFRMPLNVAPRELTTLFARFAAAGIAARHGVDQLAHRLAALPDAQFPNAVQRLRSTISLPYYPALELDDARMIADIAASLL
jgi:perosamine synthetase